MPDVSGISINLQVERFEIPFFAVDTNNLRTSLQQLRARYPGFTQDFLFNILGTTPDSVGKDVPLFISSYKSLADSAERKYRDFGPIEEQVKRAFRFVHYYFPAYKLPAKLITFIGPINSYANILTKDAVAVGLQLYMGKDYPIYLTEQGQGLYPAFVSRKFEPEYITVNCIKNIIDDMYPVQQSGRPLIEQMIESGKRWYLLDRFLPGMPDSVKTGYTQKQWEGCNSNEQEIWRFFVQNNLLYSTDPDTNRDYLNDGPNTPALGEASPGNIGQFVGGRIVQKWMEKKGSVSLDALMKTPARTIFDEAKYKPK
ncbi:MAG: gliding motility lipoprotein GldB [Sediminibacterium sp.]